MYIMQSDPNDIVRKKFKEAAPEAARIVLVNFVGKTDMKVSNDELPELVFEALAEYIARDSAFYASAFVQEIRDASRSLTFY